jgi:hypothetical protein
VDGWIDGRIEERKSGQKDGQTDGRTDRRMDGLCKSILNFYYIYVMLLYVRLHFVTFEIQLSDRDMDQKIDS